MADPRDNLIVSANFPPEERSRRARIAAKASAKARKKKKSMKDAMNLLLELDVEEEKKAILRHMGIEDDDMNNLMLMLVSAFQCALGGDVKAMEFIANITGSKAQTENEKARIKIEKEKLKLEKQKLKEKQQDTDFDDGVVIINDT